MQLVTRQSNRNVVKGDKMCLAPVTMWIPDAEGGRSVTVACRQCEQCRKRAIRDWVGRCIAESKTAVAAHAVTLTYDDSALYEAGGQTLRATLLTYSDVQKYLKLLRRHGYPVRYFVAGEFGTIKGRAHWHILLFWQGQVPPFAAVGGTKPHKWFPHPITPEVNWKDKFHWPHGFSWWKPLAVEDVRYAVSYIRQDMGDMQRQGHLAVSLKPPLGAEYFSLLAKDYVKQGLAPQSTRYTFAEATYRVDGVDYRQRFDMWGATLDVFLNAYVFWWTQLRPGEEIPRSEIVEAFMERLPAGQSVLPFSMSVGSRPKPVWGLFDEVDIDIDRDRWEAVKSGRIIEGQARSGEAAELEREASESGLAGGAESSATGPDAVGEDEPVDVPF